MLKTLILLFAFVILTESSIPSTQQRRIFPKKPNFIRPCKLNHLKCIRDNLAANSKCNKSVVGSIPNEYIIKKFIFHTPSFNSTYVDHNLVIKNHDKCRVSEFFYHVNKDVAVLALDCPGLIFSSNRTLIQHYSLREDKIYSYTSTWEYPLIRLTVNFKPADKMDLCNSFVFTDVTALPRFVISPNDKKTNNFLSRDLSRLKFFERETFFFRGPPLFRRFVNSKLCNFGCFD